VLPALLVVLGPKVNAGRIRWIKTGNRTESRIWGRIAAVVMKRPALTALPVVGVLLVLALPIGHISFLPPDERVLPKSAPAHEAGDLLRSQFATQPNAVEVVLTHAVPNNELTSYAKMLSNLPGAQLVASSAGSFVRGASVPPPIPPPSLAANGSQRLRLFSALQPQSNAAQQLVKDVRATSPPHDTTVYVGGYSAEIVDSKHSIGSRLWLAGLLIVIACLILLFLFTGSILQPIRALIGNAFTLGATFGAMVWIFQDGHLSSLLGFTATPTDTDMPVLLFCVAFGLSMDYEVFLISRIKELHDRGENNEVAVVTGLSRTGRIVSMAASLLAVSFFAFGTSHVSFIQFFGLGTGMAILIDATLVRGVLVPAFQRVFGERSWYAPRALRRVYTRFGFHEAATPLPAPQ
jgi:RND superfamily putative drug exporter